LLRRPVEFTQYLSIRYTERLAEEGLVASVGSVGDSYDNALAESIIGLYKTELINQQRPWKNLDQVEYATRKWVGWATYRLLNMSRITTMHKTVRPTLPDSHETVSNNPGAVHSQQSAIRR
jgi:putative transposase